MAKLPACYACNDSFSRKHPDPRTLPSQGSMTAANGSFSFPSMTALAIRRYSVTRVPSSTTWFGGRPKKSAAVPALLYIRANRASRQ